ncbi:MAG: hypothetical protein JWM56_142 [Candidatus Peribacteria bacterium]|nr:hypothetical protein [Candidatus Peribacteria bacterium]
MILRLGDLFSVTLASAKERSRPILLTATLFMVVNIIMSAFILLFGVSRAAQVLIDLGAPHTQPQMRALLFGSMSEGSADRQALSTEMNTLAMSIGGREIEKTLDRLEAGDPTAKAEITKAVDSQWALQKKQTVTPGQAPNPKLITEKEMAAVPDLIAGTERSDISARKSLRSILMYKTALGSDAFFAIALARVVREMPIFMALILLAVLVGVFMTKLVQATYLLVASGAAGPMTGIWLQAMRYILPLIGVGIWSFLRSYIWVPLLSIIPGLFYPPFLLILFLAVPAVIILALIFYPRFWLAQAYLIQDKVGIRQSVQLSYERSRGYWGKIFGNIFVWNLVIGISLWIVQIIIGLLMVIFVSATGNAYPLFSVLLASGAKTFTTQIGMALGLFFLVQLALSIKANPYVSAMDGSVPGSKVFVPTAPVPSKPSAAKAVSKKVVKKTVPKKKSSPKSSDAKADNADELLL